jgi:hypothetical protein
MNKLLDKVYYDPSSNACYSGVNAIHQEAKKQNPKVTKAKVVEYLQKQRTYTLHKPIRKKFARNRVVPCGFDTDWQADLCDMQKLKKENNGFGYILTCIEVLSRYAWAVPVQTKTPQNVAIAFKQILKTGRRPWRLATDMGKEFLGAPFQELLKQEDIQHMIPKNETKCCVVERYNRTLKTRLWKVFTKQNNNKWLSILPKIVKAINHSYNRSIKCSPASVNRENATQLWLKLYGKSEPNPTYKYNIGNQVRISKQKHVFEKGYLPNFSEEIFTIQGRINRQPPVYQLKDSTGEILEGYFYERELVKVVTSPEDVYLIEKILKTRIRKCIKEALVKWKGYLASASTWEPLSDIVTIE